MSDVVAEYPQLPAASAAALSSQSTPPTKVLLIEDNPIDTQLVQGALADLRDRELYGPIFDVTCTALLSRGLTYLSQSEFDVVLLDLSLPDSKGLEQTFDQVRAKAPNLPIIVLTGLGDEAFGLKVVRAGAQDYLIKDRVDRHLLIKSIRYAIERKRTEQALRESEEKFRSIVETTSEWIWSMDREARYTYSNPAVEAILGYRPDDLFGETNLSLLHLDDRAKLELLLAKARRKKRGWSGVVLRWRHKDGSFRWLESNAVPIIGNSGELLGYRGADRDITEREKAKEERMQLELRLVTVQEEERHRIARELHDQMGQSLAALMLGLKSLRDSGQFHASADERLQQIQDLTNQLAQQVHSIAMNLRPTALDDLGLHTALSNYIEEWSERSKILADFYSSGLVKRRLPTHIETTVYRIMQEALTNVLKHARAHNVSIIVEQGNDRVQAIIEDDGCGFDAEAMVSTPVSDRRLGLLGMEERTALVGGKLTIESMPGVGTTLFVRIPTSTEPQVSQPWRS